MLVGLRTFIQAMKIQLGAFEHGLNKDENPQLSVLIDKLKKALKEFEEENKEVGPILPNASSSKIALQQEFDRKCLEKLTQALNVVNLQVAAFEIDRDNTLLNAFCHNIRSILKTHEKHNDQALLNEEAPFPSFLGISRKHKDETESEFQADTSKSKSALVGVGGFGVNCLPEISLMLQTEEHEIKPPRKKPKYIRCYHCNKFSLFPDSIPFVTPRDTPPEEQVFSNELLMKIILRNLTDSELRDIRGTNIFWNQISTKLLLSKQKFKIDVYYPGYGGTHIVELAGMRNKPLLENLNDCLKISVRTFNEGKFPSNSVILRDPELDATDIQHFFVLHGEQIKFLRLHFQENTPISAFKLLLVFQAPNVHHLHLDNIPFDWTTREIELFPEPFGFNGEIQLSQLRYLTFSAGCIVSNQILQDLLRVASNLEVFTGFKEEYIDSFVNVNKVHVIKELRFEPQYNQDSLDLYEKLGNANLKIIKLVCDLRLIFNKLNALPMCAASLSQILKSSANTLQYWTMEPVRFLSGIVIPKLPNLIKINLQVLYDKTNWREMFPLGFNIFDTFPSLHSFKIDIRRRVEIENDNDNDSEDAYDDDNEGRQTFYEYFEDYSPHEQVTSLECGTLDYYYHLSNFILPVFWTKKLAAMFPYLQSANFGKMSNFPAVATTIWRLSTLKKLDISLDIESISMDAANVDIVCDLDVAFTGISRSDCEIALNTTVDNVECVGANTDPHAGLRKSPSIVDLKNLETFNLQFYDCYNYINSSYDPIFSELTGIAFRACHKLEVNLNIRPRIAANLDELKAALDPIISYVTVTSEPC